MSAAPSVSEESPGISWAAQKTAQLSVDDPGDECSTADIIRGRDNLHSLIRKLATPFVSAQLQQDEDNLSFTLSHSGPDPWASYRTHIAVTLDVSRYGPGESI